MSARRGAGGPRIRLSALALAATAALALSGCANDRFADDYAANSDQGYVAGDGSWQVIPVEERKAPVVFEGTTQTGETLTSDQLTGNVAVVNFWYAACPPCRAEAADLQTTSHTFGDRGVQFLGVNVYDQAPTIDSFNTEYGISYPSIIDVNDASVRLAFSANVPPQAIPSTLVIDRAGRVAATIRGVADPNVLQTMIEDALAEATS